LLIFVAGKHDCRAVVQQWTSAVAQTSRLLAVISLYIYQFIYKVM
jgi:hypothetical protein